MDSSLHQTLRYTDTAGLNRRMRKTARTVVWEGAGNQSGSRPNHTNFHSSGSPRHTGGMCQKKLYDYESTITRTSTSTIAPIRGSCSCSYFVIEMIREKNQIRLNCFISTGCAISFSGAVLFLLRRACVKRVCGRCLQPGLQDRCHAALVFR